jgi:phage replication-related protein YjqB (UPF0714/DUF867 family)
LRNFEEWVTHEVQNVIRRLSKTHSGYLLTPYEKDSGEMLNHLPSEPFIENTEAHFLITAPE